MSGPSLPELEAERERLYAQLAATGDFRQGLAPRDGELGLTGQTMSPGLAKTTARASAAEPFAKASGLLAELAGVRGDRPAGRTVRRCRRQCW
jgi:hypothetical protein